MIKMSSNNYKEIDFDELSSDQQEKKKPILEKHENVFKGTIGNYNKTKVKLIFKKGINKHYQ